MFQRVKAVGIIILISIFLIIPVMIGINLKKSEGFGSGFIIQATTTTTVNATTATLATVATKNIQGFQLVIEATSFSPNIKVNSISDTLGNAFGFEEISRHFEDAEIWAGNYTKANFAADTVTVTFSASTSSVVRLYYLTSSAFINVTVTSNFGTATSMSVPSFTPPSLYACLAFGVANTGSVTGTTFGTPNFWYQLASSQLGALAFDDASVQSNVWNNYGSTTISISMTPTSSPQWDMVASCWSEGPATTTLTTTTTSGIITSGNFSVFLLAIPIAMFPLIFIFRRRIRRL